MKLSRFFGLGAIVMALGLSSLSPVQALPNDGTFNPRDYGATCNASGVGDDAGISAAITALQNAGGGALIVPGKCVVTSPKVVTGVPVTIKGNSIGASQLIASGNYGPAGSFLLRLDITANSDLTAEVHDVGFRTYQQEQVAALQIEGQPAGLYDRVNISDLEIRGADVGYHGFSYGLQLVNIGGPKIARTTITGRQSPLIYPATKTAPSNFDHMEVCFSVANNTGTQTNYGFSDARCNNAKIGWNIDGYAEGIVCTRCYAIAVGTGWRASSTAIVPLISISQSHADFFNTGVEMRWFSQSHFASNLFYHRSDATAGTTGTCYYIQGVDRGPGLPKGASGNTIVGGGCFESGDPGRASTVGVVFDQATNNVVSDVILEGLIIGVNNANGSTGNVYRRGQWLNPAAGAGEFGNGGSTSNVCIGHNAPCS